MVSKGISILGSTGSIGCNTLRVIETLAEPLRVVALAAGNNVGRLAEQVQTHLPEVVSVENEKAAGT
jgi:1-deoxy-D-xylulose-5-phosphate reductoisomerase